MRERVTRCLMEDNSVPYSFKTISVFVFFLYLFSIPMVPHAELYCWTDDKGVKHYSNSPPPQAPVEVRQIEEIVFDEEAFNERQKQKEILEKKIRERIVEMSEKKETPRPQKAGNVIMYTTSRCGYCVKAKSFFQQHGIGFTEYNVDQSAAALKQFQELNGRGVPLIFIGDKRIAGFNEAAIRMTLGMP